MKIDWIIVWFLYLRNR